MFRIICADCECKISTDTAKAMREHATGVYSFICLSCLNDAQAQQKPNY